MRNESLIQSLITVKDAAKKAQLPYMTVLEAVNTGKLKAFQPGGRKWLIHKKDLEIYLDEYKPKPIIENTNSELFVTENNRNIELRNQAIELMREGNLLFGKAYDLLKEIA